MAATVLLPLFILLLAGLGACSAANFSSLLVFGDSTVDTGNNNYISTSFKANHVPYGVGFPGKIPTGRFSDGLLVPDMLLSELGIGQLLPPFLKPNISGDDLRRGVSFASAGSGFDEVTAASSGVISVPKQVDMFKQYIVRLKSAAGRRRPQGSSVRRSFSSAPPPMTSLSASTTPREERQLHHHPQVYDLGGRRFLVWGISPIGCGPLQITMKLLSLLERSCVENENADTVVFNSKLQALLGKLQKDLPESKFSFADLYAAATDIFQQPQKYGFVEARRGCCGTGLMEAGELCSSLTPTCPTPPSSSSSTPSTPPRPSTRSSRRT
ncbi:unnamed protein product [Spirodela intermedia]|uniref:Uncharacterized protein n=1 Tax=Spirodela intermedia TaxID=51605 RepID=A0A7I8ILJ7_SPIIN|nr:unnamed protein product [Spirodela intermedia]CAA6658806.1 unnamed protein product [Spirodela intermedia]